jgi:flagellar basal body P-ring protein FlgI
MNRTLKVVVSVTLIGLFFVTATHAWQDTAGETAVPAESESAAEADVAEPAPVKPAADIPSVDERNDDKRPAEPPRSEEPAVEEDEASPSDELPEVPAAVAEALRKIRAGAVADRLRVGDICEVKHYRQERLQGYGMAVDLREAFSRPKLTVRAEEVAKQPIAMPELLNLLESPLGEGDPAVLAKLQEAGQLTLVAVTASVVPQGVRKGERIDCEVRALDGKNLENAYLLPTALALPGPAPETAPAIAAGPIATAAGYRAGAAKVALGVLVQEDICDQFVKDAKITLVLKEEHACFLLVQEIVDLINDELSEPVARALNRFNVEVSIPEPFQDDPVAFVTVILQLHTSLPARGEIEFPAAPKRTLFPARPS